MKTSKVQFGQAATADFEENTYTFEMDGEFEVRAGKYAIVPIETWEQHLADFDKMRSALENAKKQIQYLESRRGEREDAIPPFYYTTVSILKEIDGILNMTYNKQCLTPSGEKLK